MDQMELTQAQWDHQTAEFADDLCRHTHPEAYASGIDTHGLGKPVGAACQECVIAAKARTTKLQKAHGTVLSPEESANLRQRFGLDETLPDPALARTLPEAHQKPGDDDGSN